MEHHNDGAPFIPMKQNEFKELVVRYANGMMDKWFGQGTMKDNFAKAAARTIIASNIDRYDNVIDIFTDNKGNVMLDEFIDNLIDTFNDWHMDLDDLGIPLLPHKILILSKQDLYELKELCLQYKQEDEMIEGTA